MCRYTKVRWTGGRRTVDAVGLERWRFCWVSGFASSPNRYLWCCVVLVVPRGGGQDSTMAKNSMALCLPAHPSVYGSSALRTGILNYLVFFTYFTCDMFISVCWLVDCTISAFSTTSNWPHSEKKTRRLYYRYFKIHDNVVTIAECIFYDSFWSHHDWFIIYIITHDDMQICTSQSNSTMIIKYKYNVVLITHY
jgi:hypothetical protein